MEPLRMLRRIHGRVIRDSHSSPEHVNETPDRLMGFHSLFSHEYDEAFYNLVLDGVYLEA